MNGSEEVIFTKEMCERLECSPGTLRKWSLELEKNGYVFQKSEAGKRFFTVYDETALRRFKHLTSQNFSKEHAAQVVTAGMNKNRSGNGTPEELIIQTEQEQSSNVPSLQENTETILLLKTLTEHVKEQERLNTELMQKLEEKEEQSRADRERLEQKIGQLENRLLKDSEQRDKKLMEGIRQLQEQKQEILQIAAAKEEVEVEPNKRGFLSRLFNRK